MLGRRLLPSPVDVLLVAALLAPLAVHMPDYDCLWHLRAGELILDLGRIPTPDDFSFTARGKPWFAHEWLPEAAFAAITRAFGLDSLLLLKSIVLTGTMALVWRALSGLADAALARLLVSIAVFASLVPTLTPRPWMLSFLALALLIVLHRAPRPSWMPSAVLQGLLLSVWMNLHGMYVVGYLWLSLQLLGAFFESLRKRLADPRRDVLRPILAMALGLSGALVHPYGAAILAYPLEYQFTETHSTILEWQPPDMASSYGRLLLIIYVLGLLALARGRTTAGGWITFLSLSYLAFTSRRNIAIMALGSSPFVADALASLVARRGEEDELSAVSRFLRRRMDNFDAVAREARSMYWLPLSVLLALFFLVVNPRQGPADALFKTEGFDRAFPVRAVEWLLAQPAIEERRIFNFYGWGGYLIHRGYPLLRTFIDGRADLFGLDHISDYHAVILGRPRWREVLERHRTDTVLLPPGQPLLQILERDDSWRLAYRDDVAVVYRRQANTR